MPLAIFSPQIHFGDYLMRKLYALCIALMLALCLVPPAMLFKLWPAAPDRSMKDLMYESESNR